MQGNDFTLHECPTQLITWKVETVYFSIQRLIGNLKDWLFKYIPALLEDIFLNLFLFGRSSRPEESSTSGRHVSTPYIILASPRNNQHVNYAYNFDFREGS
jgi:hypothetical protein